MKWAIPILAGIIILGIMQIPFSDSYIPPTRAFSNILVDNKVLSADSYAANLTLTNGANVNLVGNVTDNSIIISATSGSAPNELYCSGTDKFSSFNATTMSFQCSADDTGSGGEANTGSNVGTGTGTVFRDKTGVTLNFKTLKNGSNISITNNADDITISASGTGGGIVSIDSDTTSDQTLQGTVGNITVTDNGIGTHAFNLGDLVVIVNGAAQTITKTITLNTLLLGGLMDAQSNTIDNVGILISNATQPAISGKIRLGNTEEIRWNRASGVTSGGLTLDSANRLALVGSMTEFDYNGVSILELTSLQSNAANTPSTGILRLGNNEVINWRNAGNTNNEGISFDSNDKMQITISGTNEYGFNSTYADMGTNKLAGTMGCADGDFLQLGNGDWDCRSITNSTVSGLPTVLGSDITCTQTASYCTVFTVPLTASSGNVIDFHLMVDSNTAGGAVQFRGRADDAQATGTCTIIAQSTLSTQSLDSIAVGTAPADDGNTAWFAGANIAQYEQINCVVEADASNPQNLILEMQEEVASTGTIQKGSNYVKTP